MLDSIISNYLSNFKNLKPTGLLDNLTLATWSHPLDPIPGIDNVLKRDHINVLTYNFFLRPPGVQDNPHDDHKDHRVKEFLNLLPEYDIVCLEEVFGIMNKRKTSLIEYGQEAGFLYSTDSPGPSPQSGCLLDGGLLILSSFPILTVDFKAFPKGAHMDGLVEKGVLYVKIQVKGAILHIFHAHQFTDYTLDSAEIRGKAFKTWREFMEKCLNDHGYKKDDLCLLLGDFNVSGIGHEYEAMHSILSHNKTDDIEDLLLMKFATHPLTFFGSLYGDGTQSLTLDYIFNFIPKGILRSSESEAEKEKRKKGSKLNIIADSIKVEEFLVTGMPFKQLSDHHGLVISLEHTEEII